MIRELTQLENTMNGPRPDTSHMARIQAGVGDAEEERQQAVLEARMTIALHADAGDEARQLRHRETQLKQQAEDLLREAGELSQEASLLEMRAADVRQAESQLVDRLLPEYAKDRLRAIQKLNRDIFQRRKQLDHRIKAIERLAKPAVERGETTINEIMNPPLRSPVKVRNETKAQRAERLRREAMVRDSAARELPALLEKKRAIEEESQAMEVEATKIRRSLIDSDEHHAEIERLRAVAAEAEATAGDEDDATTTTAARSRRGA